MFVINLCSGPGAGKSVLASDIFSDLKKAGIRTELVQEYAKDLVYEESWFKLNNQIGVFSKQLEREIRVWEKKKADVIVTDTSLLLSIVYYAKRINFPINPYFNDMVMWEYNQFNNLTYYIERNDSLPYQQDGRSQDKEGAKQIDEEVLEMLNNFQVPYTKLNLFDARAYIVNDVQAKLNK